MLILDKPTQIAPKLIVGQEADLDPRVFSFGTLVADPQIGVIKVADGESTFEDLPTQGGSSSPVNWNDVTGKPGTFPPEVHSHVITDTTGLQTALDGKAASIHTHGDATTSTAGFMSAADKVTLARPIITTPAPAYITGRYYDGSVLAAGGVITGAANRCDLYPVMFPAAFTADRIGLVVSTNVASALAKVVIYSATAAGWPDVLLYESASNLDCATTGLKELTPSPSLAFTAGVTYWLGARYSSTATFRGVPATSTPNLGFAAGGDSDRGCVIRRTITFANAAPSAWTFVASEIVSGAVVPSVRMRST